MVIGQRRVQLSGHRFPAGEKSEGRRSLAEAEGKDSGP